MGKKIKKGIYFQKQKGIESLSLSLSLSVIISIIADRKNK